MEEEKKIQNESGNISTSQEGRGAQADPKTNTFGDRRRSFEKKPPFDRSKSFRKPFAPASEEDSYETHLVSLRAVSKTRAGGRQRSFSILVLAGNRKGLIGCGTGKSADIVEAIKKAERRAKKSVFQVPMRGSSIANNSESYFCGTKIIIKNVPDGTGMKAGGVARHVFNMAGITNISCKCIGNSTSDHNVIYATLDALKKIQDFKTIQKRLNKTPEELLKRRVR